MVSMKLGYIILIVKIQIFHLKILINVLLIGELNATLLRFILTKLNGNLKC